MREQKEKWEEPPLQSRKIFLTGLRRQIGKNPQAFNLPRSPITVKKRLQRAAVSAHFPLPLFPPACSSPAEQCSTPCLHLFHCFSPSFCTPAPSLALLLFSLFCALSSFSFPAGQSLVWLFISILQVLDDGSISDTFTHKSLFPEDMDPLSVSGTLNPDGTLVVSVRQKSALTGNEHLGIPVYNTGADLWPVRT